MEFPPELEVEIEVPRGGFVKRKEEGSVDFVSPLPCPFNYGSVPGTRSGDGDRLDALVLGKRRRRGERCRVQVVGRVDFVDAGADDPKFVCSDRALRPHEQTLIVSFFAVYALAKRVLNRLRGKLGVTRFQGLTLRTR